MARVLVQVGGVVGVTLGGSRARGTADEHSDVDLGVYYRGDLDVAAVRELARRHDPDSEVSERGGWGPWVDGGAWLVVGGTRVDWLYRDLDRVERIRDECEQGRVECHFQIGHPHGFWTSAYVAELALSRILADPHGALRAVPTDYPEALSRALSTRARWEADFILDAAEKGAKRGDTAWVAGCLYRAAGCLSQARHAEAREWVTTEKGTIAPDLAAPLRDLRDLTRAIELLRRAGAAQKGGHGIAGQSPDGSG